MGADLPRSRLHHRAGGGLRAPGRPQHGGAQRGLTSLQKICKRQGHGRGPRRSTVAPASGARPDASRVEGAAAVSRRLTAAVTGLVLAASALVPVALAPTASAAERTATLVGDLQSEAGCAGDWQPDCATTDLVRQPGTTTFTKDLAGPAGRVERQGRHRPRLGRGLREGRRQRQHHLPAGGAGDPAVHLRRHHAQGGDRTDRPAGVRSDGCRPGDRRRQPAQRPDQRALLLRHGRPVRQRRPGNDQGGLTGGPLQTGLDPTNKGFYHGGDLAGRGRQARLHQGPRHHGDLADAVVQEPAGPGHRRQRRRRLPRLLDHRLHPDRPAPRHERRDERASSTRPTPRG